ncbi:hypothetical protein V8G54_012033 [Vigna mungo]|uniref:Retrotransposon gag domain-containing protein n=1 Tax=Vigna mungo TaxID=3915 RepID=A0AAQ3NTF1_VIGMU
MTYKYEVKAKNQIEVHRTINTKGNRAVRLRQPSSQIEATKRSRLREQVEHQTEEAQIVATRSMEEEYNTRDLIAQMQAQIQAHARTIQHSVSTTKGGNNHQNENDGSRNRQPSQHTNPNDRGRREPSLLQIVQPSSLLPFTATIMQTLMSEKNPHVLEKYDGSTDPDNHLRIFTNAMTFYTDSDPYNTLPPNIVDCFATVQNLFRRQYASNRKQEITPAELVNTKQEKDETLKAFMKRYNETAQRVKDVNHTFIINNLPSCLRPEYFAERLNVRPPKTMDKLQERIAKFIHLKDMRNSRKKQQEVYAGGSKKEGRQSFNNNDKNGGMFHKDFIRTPRYEVKANNQVRLTEYLHPSPVKIEVHRTINTEGNRAESSGGDGRAYADDASSSSMSLLASSPIQRSIKNRVDVSNDEDDLNLSVILGYNWTSHEVTSYKAFKTRYYNVRIRKAVHAKGLRTNPFGVHATHLGHENLEKEQKLKDDEEDLSAFSGTSPLRSRLEDHRTVEINTERAVEIQKKQTERQKTTSSRTGSDRRYKRHEQGAGHMDESNIHRNKRDLNSGMGDLPGCFPGKCARTKHTGKTRGDLWGDSQHSWHLSKYLLDHPLLTPKRMVIAVKRTTEQSKPNGTWKRQNIKHPGGPGWDTLNRPPPEVSLVKPPQYRNTRLKDLLQFPHMSYPSLPEKV